MMARRIQSNDVKLAEKSKPSTAGWFLMVACVASVVVAAACHRHGPPAGSIKQCSGQVRGQLPKVAVLPFGDFSPLLAGQAAGWIQSFYPVEAKVLTPVPMPAAAWYPVRGRYRADTILNILHCYKPAGYNYIIALTNNDISCTSDPFPDWGVLGYGEYPGQTCIVSSFRMKGPSITEKHFLERLQKVVLHELGHNFGLDHCSAPACLMADAEGTIATVDREKVWICPACSKKSGKN